MGRFVSATGQFLLATYEQFSCPPMGSFSCPLTHLFPDDLDAVADKMDDLVSGCAQNVPTKEIGQGEDTP